MPKNNFKMKHEDRFLQPTKEQNALDVGDRVEHTKYGVGRVTLVWGAWYSCRECYSPVSTNWEACPSCSNPLNNDGIFLATRITAHDTVDVEFEDGKTRSINKVWLQPKPGWTPAKATYVKDDIVALSSGRSTEILRCTAE